MKGAIVFLVCFCDSSLSNFEPTLQFHLGIIYKAVLPNTEQYTSTYAIAGTNAFALIIAVFNGVIYAFIAWLIFTIVMRGQKKDKNQHVTVNVNNNTEPPPK